MSCKPNTTTDLAVYQKEWGTRLRQEDDPRCGNFRSKNIRAASTVANSDPPEQALVSFAHDWNYHWGGVAQKFATRGGRDYYLVEIWTD